MKYPFNSSMEDFYNHDKLICGTDQNLARDGNGENSMLCY
jgi:hypothetical protein